MVAGPAVTAAGAATATTLIVGVERHVPRYDIALTGGWVVDGSGAPPLRADVAITGSRIVAIGRLGATAPDATSSSAAGRPLADTVIDATGRYVLPGLIDTHVHTDAVAGDPDVAAAALHQGVTTLIGGQDGISFAPSGRETIRAAEQYFSAVNGACPAPLADGCTVADLLAHYDGAAQVNVAYAAPAGTIRAEVMGYESGPASGAQLRAMQAAVEGALADGAVGLSTGLEYVPGCYAGAGELAELCAPVAEVGGVYVSHMRGYEANAWRGLAEACEIGRRADVATHISHLHGPSYMITTLVDEARTSGVDLTFDSYPYLRGSTIVAMVALPSSIQEGGPSATLTRLADPAVRETLRRDWFPTIDDVLPRITLSYVDSDDWRWAEGMTLPDAAARAGLAAGEFVCELVAATKMGAGCVFAQPPTNTESDVRALMRHEAHMGGSDAIFLGARPHPRGWGTFARYLGRHTRDLGDWTWGEAASHLAGHPARRFGLEGRGVIRAGAVADVVVLDPATIADRSTYDAPRTVATGVDHVLVSGRFALKNGVVTGIRAGRGLRRGVA